jgi:hypothetical protein
MIFDDRHRIAPMLVNFGKKIRLFPILVSALALSLATLCAAQAETGTEATAGAPAIDANALVKRADTIRFPRESFQTDITVTNYNDGEAGDMRQYEVLSRGNENTIVLTTAPASERGQALLMRGRDLWIFMPSVSQPVRLSRAAANVVIGNQNIADVAVADPHMIFLTGKSFRVKDRQRGFAGAGHATKNDRCPLLRRKVEGQKIFAVEDEAAFVDM